MIADIDMKNVVDAINKEVNKTLLDNNIPVKLTRN
jgi:hypothetical protein